MKLKVNIILIILAFPLLVSAQEKLTLNPVYRIIPRPVSVVLVKGKNVIIDKTTLIFSDARFAAQAAFLTKQIQDQCGLQLSVQLKRPSGKGTSAIILAYESTPEESPETYLLTAKNKRVFIKASHLSGIVHGIETFMQLLPLSRIESASVPPVAIHDYPRFAFRGMHLDVSRHFFPVDYIKKYIDYLAFYKFNTFHWHLTDDQGWRIEIKKYPKLTQVGAWRDSTLIGHFRDKPARYDGIPYGGFYTQEDIKDVIKYAAVRGIMIIPEIDIPGHSRAIIASYPELSTNPDTTFRVATSPGMYNRKNNVLAPNEKTFVFLKDVFDEIADLFPSPYIHIGGDECSQRWWKADPNTQRFMKEHGIKNETALQNYFVEQVIGDLKVKGKKVIGWDEILEGHPDTSAIIMNWRGVKAAVQAVKEKHHVIMSPGEYTYFNYSQTKNEDSLTQGGYLPLNKVYHFEPIPFGVDSSEAKYILGGQGNVWTEYIASKAKLEYMIFPRMLALSEALWTPENLKDYTGFKRRVKENGVPWCQFGKINYFKNYDSENNK